MKVTVFSIPVQNQEDALQFYTEKLGFVKKHDIPLSEGNRWLTVVAKGEQEGTQVLLKPSPIHFEPAKIYQEALFEAGIPYTQFSVEDAQAEFERLQGLGVRFSMPPTVMGPVKMAVLDDTCGNYIQIVQML